MNTIFMNSNNSKTCDPHRILLNLTDKINLKIRGSTKLTNIFRKRTTLFNFKQDMFRK